ncbi:MAG: peptidase [Parcubacteria group bacterium]|nr:peptidase [Parcubacteria group bacterium]
MTTAFIFQIAILIMSVVIHEVSHGYMANYLGDPTAKLEGRLTLNPLKHLDLVGSFIVPVIAYFTGGFIFGWAKPVPYNPYNLRPGRWPEALVALAGPASNLILAVVFGLFLRFSLVHGVGNAGFAEITMMIVLVNLVLTVFNLVPLPPLDGSKLLFALFPERMYKMRHFFERYGFVLVLLFIFYGWGFVSPIVGGLFTLITGLPLS